METFSKESQIFGHKIGDDSIIKSILVCKMEGRGPQDTPRAQWCDKIKEWSAHSLVECTPVLANKRVM